MMIMDDRDSAKCRKSKTWGHNCHFRICLSEKKTKKRNSGCLLQISKEKNVKRRGRCSGYGFLVFRERVSNVFRERVSNFS